MQTEDRLSPLLDRWVAEADAGRLLPAAELCRDCPELLPDVEREIAVLRQFHVLARPNETMSVDAHAEVDTTTDQPAVAVPDGPSPSPGSKIGRYQIIAELGKGGMGIVYKARDTKLNREVVLKFVRADVAANPTASDRFLREAKALAAIRHDHVVEIYDYGEENGVRFITMPLLAGETLEARLKREGPFSPAEVVRIGTELAEGLAAVHEKGLIHRDLKPSNVWLEAPNGRVKLLDFGLARDRGADDRVTRAGTVVGTPAYMSPEQVNGLDLDARTDLFSLGSVLYKAATGQLAFAAKTATATLKFVGENDPPPARIVNPVIPTGLSDLIEWLHRKNPADRPASAAQVVKALRGLATAPETPTTDWRGAPAVDRGRKRWPNRVRIAAATRAFSLGVTIVVIVLYAARFRERLLDNSSFSQDTKPTEPLRVRALDIHHLEPVNEKQSRPRGRMGTESYRATTMDAIRVTAHLSRPAYCYLIVFRPDGKEEFLPPKSANRMPELIEELRYPSTRGGDVYFLSDGNGGLWLVALVASDKPLPPYSDWRKQHPDCPWTRSPGQPGVVWFDDGVWPETATAGGHRSRGERGEKKLAGAAPIEKLVDWLKTETSGVVSAVAFTVEERK